MPRTLQEIVADFLPWDGTLPPVGCAIVQAYRFRTQKKTAQLVIAHHMEEPPASATRRPAAETYPFVVKTSKPGTYYTDGIGAVHKLKEAPVRASFCGRYRSPEELKVLLTSSLPTEALDAMLSAQIEQSISNIINPPATVPMAFA